MLFNQLPIIDAKLYHKCQLLGFFRISIFEKKNVSYLILLCKLERKIKLGTLAFEKGYQVSNGLFSNL